MLTLLNDLKAILSAPGLSRSAILTAYLRVRIQARWTRSKTPGIRLFGHRIWYTHYAALLHTFREIFIAQQYWFETDSDQPLVIDGGANIGMSVLYFKLLYPDARLLAFEADPDTFRLLEQNIQRNNMQCVELHQAALGASDQRRMFYRDHQSPGSLIHSLIEARVSSAGRSSIAVNGVRLSAHISGSVSLLKLDLEGAEHEVLEDLEQHGQLSQIEHSIIEYHHQIAGQAVSLASFLTRLERAGWAVDIEARRPATAGGFQDLVLYCQRV